MDNIQNKLEKLKQLEYLIKYSRNDKRRLCLLNDYISLVLYFDMIEIINFHKVINESEFELERYHIYVNKELKNVIDEYIDNMDIIINITNNLENVYNRFLLIPQKYSERSYLNYEKGINLLRSFFQILGNDFCKIFEFTLKNNLINSSTWGRSLCYDTSFTDNSSQVVIKRPKYDYQYFQSFAHELGHCYEHQLQPNKKFFSCNNTSEVVSIFLQKIFNYYIYSTTNLKEQAQYYNMLSQVIQHDMFEKVKTGNNIFKNGGFCGIYGGNYDLEWNIKKINGDKKITFYDYLYVLNDIMACNLVKLYIDNPKEGLKELKNFITTNHAYSFRERLIEYGSVDGVTLSIKNAHEYQKSHHYYKNK